jgi:hypothetical protein
MPSSRPPILTKGAGLRGAPPDISLFATLGRAAADTSGCMPRLKGKRKQLNGRNPDNEDHDCHWIVLEPGAHDFLRPAHSGLIVVSSRLSALASIVVEPL